MIEIPAAVAKALAAADRPTDPAPPAHLWRIVAALGTSGALTFLSRFGGAGAYLGRTDRGGEVREVMGDRATAALLAEYGAGRIERVPSGRDWIVAVLAARGCSVSDIARALHTTDRSVREVRRRFRPGPPDWRERHGSGLPPPAGAAAGQMDLFGAD